MFPADSNRFRPDRVEDDEAHSGHNVGQRNFYVAVVDDTLRRPHHGDTVGLLLCASRNERTVRYALGRSTSPMAVAGYRFDQLPALEQAALPGEQELLELVDRAFEKA